MSTQKRMAEMTKIYKTRKPLAKRYGPKEESDANLRRLLRTEDYEDQTRLDEVPSPGIVIRTIRLCSPGMASVLQSTCCHCLAETAG